MGPAFRSLRVPGLAAGLVAASLALAGCGSTTAGTDNQGVTVAGSTLDIWIAQPPSDGRDTTAADVVDAEKLAFDAQPGSKVGSFHLRLRIAAHSEVSADARAADTDSDAIAYLGEVTPGTSGVSAQITNELGLLQVSPTDTAAYLTKAVPGIKDSPQHFFPAHKTFGATFARVVPNTIAEATALAARMKAEGVRSLSVVHDGSPYGIAVAAEVVAAAGRTGIAASTTPGTPPSSAGAVLYAGLPSPAATRALDAAASADPSAKLFAPSALYDSTFVSGLSAAARKALTVSSPGFASGALDAIGAQFVSRFTQTYHHAPAPEAIFGYEAMRAVIATLSEAGDHAAQRSTVVSDFRSLRRSASDSALGAYTITGGDTDLASFVFAHVSGGRLVPVATP